MPTKDLYAEYYNAVYRGYLTQVINLRAEVGDGNIVVNSQGHTANDVAIGGRTCSIGCLVQQNKYLFEMLFTRGKSDWKLAIVVDNEINLESLAAQTIYLKFEDGIITGFYARLADSERHTYFTWEDAQELNQEGKKALLNRLEKPSVNMPYSTIHSVLTFAGDIEFPHKEIWLQKKALYDNYCQAVQEKNIDAVIRCRLQVGFAKDNAVNAQNETAETVFAQQQDWTEEEKSLFYNLDNLKEENEASLLSYQEIERVLSICETITLPKDSLEIIEKCRRQKILYDNYSQAIAEGDLNKAINLGWKLAKIPGVNKENQTVVELFVASNNFSLEEKSVFKGFFQPQPIFTWENCLIVLEKATSLDNDTKKTLLKKFINTNMIASATHTELTQFISRLGKISFTSSEQDKPIKRIYEQCLQRKKLLENYCQAINAKELGNAIHFRLQLSKKNIVNNSGQTAQSIIEASAFTKEEKTLFNKFINNPNEKFSLAECCVLLNNAQQLDKGSILRRLAPNINTLSYDELHQLINMANKPKEFDHPIIEQCKNRLKQFEQYCQAVNNGQLEEAMYLRAMFSGLTKINSAGDTSALVIEKAKNLSQPQKETFLAMNLLEKRYGQAFIELHNQLNNITKNSQSPTLAPLLNTLIEQLDPKIIANIPFQEQIELYATAQEIVKILLDVVQQPQEEQLDSLKEKLKLFFTLRETTISNTNADYCYSSTLSNQLCINITEMIFVDNEELSPFNELLSNAIKQDDTVNRQTSWQDIQSESSELPLYAEEFFRIGQDEIHIYSIIVSQTLTALEDGKVKLEDIWRGTDPKNRGPLSDQSLQILKQRSPTLKELVELTERIADYHSTKASITALQRFQNLRLGLQQGDVMHGGKEYVAGEAATLAINQFADWWHNLNKEKQTQLLKMEGLSDILKRLMIVENPLYKKNSEDTAFCVQLSGSDLQHIINSNQNFLEAFDETPDYARLPSNEQIKQIQSKIDNEIQVTPSIDIGSPLCNSSLLLNVIKQESQPLPTLTDLLKDKIAVPLKKAKYQDRDRLLKYIFSLPNNEKSITKLIELHKKLSAPRYDYLREHNIFSRYYTLNAEGKRQKTSCSWSTIEEALTLKVGKSLSPSKKQEQSKIIANNNVKDTDKNSTSEKQYTQQKNTENSQSKDLTDNNKPVVEKDMKQLFKDYTFISQPRKWRYNFKEKNDTAVLLEKKWAGGEDVDKIDGVLDEKIDSLKQEFIKH